MELFEAQRKRHSYRGPFLDRKPTREDLRRIVEAALLAPSGCNKQTTEFVAVDDPALVSQIAGMHERMEAFQQAKAFIVCLVAKEPEAVYEDNHFQVEDCAAAVQNMLLATTALGYGSVWVDGWLRMQDRAETIGRLLGVPESKVVRIILPIGAPADARHQPAKKPFEERAWFNRYGG